MLFLTVLVSGTDCYTGQMFVCVMNTIICSVSGFNLTIQCLCLEIFK